MRYLLAFCLLASGYLIGTLEQSVTAQAPVQLFDSNGNSTLYYPPSGPGGVGQYYNSDGSMGNVYTPPAPLQGFGRQSPC